MRLQVIWKKEVRIILNDSKLLRVFADNDNNISIKKISIWNKFFDFFKVTDLRIYDFSFDENLA